MHIDGLLSRFGVLFFFAVNVLSEALLGSISLDMPGKTNLSRHFLMGGKGGFTFLLVQTFLVNSITAVLLDEDSQEKDSPHSLDDVLMVVLGN